MREKIFIEPEESLSSVIDRLLVSLHNDIQFVLPEDSLLARDPLNLKVLEEEARNLGKRVMFINKSIEETQEIEEQEEEQYQETEKIKILEENTNGFSTNNEFFVKENQILNDNPEIILSAAQRKVQPISMKDIILSDKQKTVVKIVQPKKSKFVSQIKKKDSALRKKKKTDYQLLKSKDDFFVKLKRDLKGRTAGEKIETEPIKKRWSGKLIWFFAGLSVLIAVVVAFLIQPRADILIAREPVIVNKEKQVVLKTEKSDISGNFLTAIPAEIITVKKEISQDFLSSGKKTLKAKARGQITVFNKLDYDQPMIPSRFELSDGKIYWTTANIIIPANGSMKAEIVASEVGEEFNIDCSELNLCSFSVPAWKDTFRSSKIYASSITPIKGGARGEMPVVRKEDQIIADEVLQKEIFDQIDQELRNKIPSGIIVLDKGSDIKIEVTKFSEEIDNIADSFLATVQGTGRAFVFKEDAILEIFEKDIGKDVGFEMDIVDKGGGIEYKNIAVDWEKNTAVLFVGINGIAKRSLDRDIIIKDIKSKNEKEARDYFEELKGISQIRIKLFPFWLNSFPKNEEKIYLSID